MSRVRSCRKCGRRAMVGKDLCAPHYVEERKKIEREIRPEASNLAYNEPTESGAEVNIYEPRE
jgi:hypothetical protein